MAGNDNLLFISDLQVPFEAPQALKFCKMVQRHFRVAPQNVYCVGDELDQYHGSTHPKDPDAKLTPGEELRQSRETLKAWYKAFPDMKLATSNHGIRWLRKAAGAEIPSELLRAYREVIEAPKSWVWKDRWTIATRSPIRMIHGLGYSGMNGHRTAALDAGMSTVIGHLHSHAGIAYINTDGGRSIWGANAGCLIDPEAFAFQYGKWNRWKPWLGCLVVVDSGRMPILVPYEANL